MKMLPISLPSPYLTETFVIDTGKQTININIHKNRPVTQIDNAIMQIDYTRYLKSSEKAALKGKLLDSKWDSLSNLYSKKIPNHIQAQLDIELKDNYRDNDIALLEYVKENPHSYYALWKLIRLTRFGYEDIFNPLYDHFSDSLKNSTIGKKVKLHLDEFNLTSLSMKLQKFSAMDVLKSKTTTLDFKTHTYTLLEFWYSNCAPCIAQFPEMSSIYKDYHSDGFEIIGISIDKISKKEIWQEVIQKHDLKWPQLLDDNGVESSKLGINVFPSNLLVNHSGQIVHVNMRPSELRMFLSHQ
jgi:peroxiredoxin